MSHWGDSYSDVIADRRTREEKRQKEIAELTPQDLLDQLVKIIREEDTRRYQLSQIMAVSHDDHAENLRKDLLSRIEDRAQYLDLTVEAGSDG